MTRGVATAAVVMAILIGGACAPWEGETGASTGETDGTTQGHAYIAQLLPLHPLYADLARLDDEIGALRRPDALPATRVGAGAWQPGGAYTAGPGAWRWPTDAWAGRRDLTATGLREPEPPPTGILPPDLAAKLRWRKAQAIADADAQLLDAESRASQEAAAAIVALYRENQERLIGEGLGGTQEARDAVRAELEAEIDALGDKQRERLTELESRLMAGVDAKGAAAERSARREADLRLTRGPDREAEELARDMLENLQTATAPDWPAQTETAFPEPELPESSGDAGELQRRREDARKRQIGILAERREAMTRRLIRATELAAKKVARDRGIRLHFASADQARGADVTQTIGAGITQLWATGRSDHP